MSIAFLLAATLAFGATGPRADTTAAGAMERAAPDDRAAACAALAAAPADVAADVRATVRLHGGVVRWLPEAGPVRVWVQPRPATLAGPLLPAREWARAVLDGAATWHAIVPELAFAAAPDSAGADVRVVWGALTEAGHASGAAGTLATAVGRGGAARPAGRTVLRARPDGRADGATVRFALGGAEAPDTPDAVRLLARHEFGHVLGLGHHAAPRSVMAPVVGATTLAAGDRAALRVLYALPPGAACDAAAGAPRPPAAP